VNKSSYLIFKGDFGISFFRSDTAKTSKVYVKNEAFSEPIRIYKFRNIPADTFQSPYISWANLNCCNGWTYDESYLLTAVQEGKKLCAGITMDSNDELEAYINNLSDEYPRFCAPPMRNGPNTFYYVDVTRKGSISDYIDINAVQETYAALGIDSLDFGKIRGYANKQMIHLLDGTAVFDYGKPKDREQAVVTGLLLGYPLESTAAFLLG
jgi:hypothetical protein